MKRIFGGWILVMLLVTLAAPPHIADAQSPTPETKDWPGYGASAHRGENGKQFAYYCPPFDPSKGYIQGANIYGTDLYTDDTGICAAAAHAGAVIPAAGGTVTIEIRPGTTSYQGSTRNGVTSADWPHPADGSFVFVTNQPVATPLPSSCDWTGTWRRNDEKFSWKQSGTQVTGTGITDPTWRFSGTVEGNALTGKWSNSKDSGSIRIVIGADCNSFDSSWGLGDNNSTFNGHGVRASSSSGTNVQCLKELETLTVSSNSSDTLHSNSVLASGQTYAVIASGIEGLYPNTSDGFDALYDYRTGGKETRPQFGAFIYVNNQPLTDWMTASGGDIGYRSDHTYGAYIPGTDQPLAVQFHETGDYGDNAGNLTVKLCLAPANGLSGMSLQAPRRLALPNDLLLIPIKLNNVANLANLNFDMQYDPAILRQEGNLIKGNLLDNALFSSNPAEAGRIRNGFAQTSGLSGTGTVVNIPFRVIGKPGDKSPLDLKVTTVNDPSGAVPNVITISGEVLITNPDGTLPGGGGANGGGGGNGSNPGGGFGGIPKGDCDGDQHINELDALCALEMSVQLRPVQLIMDMDGSGDVTSRDAVIILQRAVGGQ